MITDTPGHQYIRVIDYKTSGSRQKALPDVDAIFQPENLKNHSDYYLQALLYSLIVANSHPDTPVAPALLYIQHAGADDYNPILKFNEDLITDVRHYSQRFTEQLCGVISQMFDHSAPLVPTSNTTHCLSCPYRQLCY